jgi:hypothetical protein
LNIRLLKAVCLCVEGAAGRSSRSLDGRIATSVTVPELEADAASSTLCCARRCFEAYAFPLCSQSFAANLFAFWRSMIREKDSWSSDVYFAWKAVRLRLRSTSGLLSSWSLESSSSSAVPETEIGVSLPQTLGVSATLPLVMGVLLVPPAPVPFAFCVLRRRTPAGSGVIAWVNFFPASRIQDLSLLSRAFRYSYCASVSASPGKKSRRMMCAIAEV